MSVTYEADLGISADKLRAVLAGGFATVLVTTSGTARALLASDPLTPAPARAPAEESP